MGLIQLHKKISQAAPIVGVSKLPDGSGYRIDFESDATPGQRQAAADIAEQWVDSPEPAWSNFMDGLSAIDGFYAKIAEVPMAAIISTRIARLADGAEWLEQEDPLTQAWNASPPSLGESQKTALISLAEATAIPIQIDGDNKLSSLA